MPATGLDTTKLLMPGLVDILRAVKGLIPGVSIACGLLIVAGTQDGVAQALLWCAALLFDYTAPLF